LGEYSTLGPNSNTFAFNLITKCGIKVKTKQIKRTSRYGSWEEEVIDADIPFLLGQIAGYDIKKDYWGDWKWEPCADGGGQER
jgi:hypothetical protein